MAESTGPERTKKLVDALKRWQGMERMSIQTMTEIIERTDNPFVRLIMEVIQRDSVLHHRVQQFMIDSVTKQAVTLTPEDMAEVWGAIEEHKKMEQGLVELASTLKEEAWDPIHKHPFDYLQTDEAKHDRHPRQIVPKDRHLHR